MGTQRRASLPPGGAPGPYLEADSFNAKRKGVPLKGADVSKEVIPSYGSGMEGKWRGHWGPDHAGGECSCVTPRAVRSPELSCLSTAGASCRRRMPWPSTQVVAGMQKFGRETS